MRRPVKWQVSMWWGPSLGGNSGRAFGWGIYKDRYEFLYNSYYFSSFFFFFFWFLISQEFIICSEGWFGHSIYYEYQHFAAASRLPRRPLPLAWIVILSACSLYPSLKLFDNSWCNTYIPCLSVLIAHRFTCGEKKIW